MLAPLASRPLRTLCGALAALMLAAPWSSGAGAASPLSASTPRCFGAASRDPETPCVNPQLRLAVVPEPEDAIIAPNSPCARLTALSATPFVCTFGVAPRDATGTVALLGDSHASHWRAAVDGVAMAERWTGQSITRSSCPYSTLPTVLPEPARTQCIRWARSIPGWFTAHPEVSTVFVSEHAGVRSDFTGPSMFEAQARAYVQAWDRLPASVQHIVVLRDTPTNRTSSNDCIEDAIAHRERAGIVCALPRRRILHNDPAATAARRLGSPRVQVVDLTSFMCSPRLCFPVIGGALVHKDVDHLTDVFAGTLAPYLQRRLAQLMRSWG